MTFSGGTANRTADYGPFMENPEVFREEDNVIGGKTVGWRDKVLRK
jgi:hypothetical protein